MKFFGEFRSKTKNVSKIVHFTFSISNYLTPSFTFLPPLFSIAAEFRPNSIFFKSPRLYLPSQNPRSKTIEPGPRIFNYRVPPPLSYFDMNLQDVLTCKLTVTFRNLERLHKFYLFTFDPVWREYALLGRHIY